jgi:energy-coupling factor transporter ATP-binding protein EcfA2
MSNNFRTDKYIHDIKYNWNIAPDVEDNNFEPLVKKIIDSNESYFITGAAGCGKSTLINMIKQNIRENIETDDEEVVVKKETKAITNIKSVIACKRHKQEKAIDKINAKIQIKESKLEDSAKRLLTKLSCAKKKETQERINKNCFELSELKKELEKATNNLNEELIELNEKVEEQKSTEVEADKIKSYVSLAPTNLAALIIDGITIHKFCCVCKSYDILHSMKFKYIFVDEVSMLQEKFYKFLLMIKKFKPETKFIISGDYNQLPTICDRISEHYNYSRNPALFELCNFNKIELTKCRRADDKLFNLIKSDNIPNLTPSNFNTTSHVTDYNVHLCFTNKKRININNALMEAKKIGYEGSSLTLNKLFYDEQSQDVTLQIDTPIIAKVNKKDIGFVNNERFKITKIYKSIITIQNDKNIIEFDAAGDDAFQRCFRVAYATTCHSSQGLTINEGYLIHQWNRYTNKMKYVSLSRATTYENINIYQ